MVLCTPLGVSPEHLWMMPRNKWKPDLTRISPGSHMCHLQWPSTSSPPMTMVSTCPPQGFRDHSEDQRKGGCGQKDMVSRQGQESPPGPASLTPPVSRLTTETAVPIAPVTVPWKQNRPHSQFSSPSCLHLLMGQTYPQRWHLRFSPICPPVLHVNPV